MKKISARQLREAANWILGGDAAQRKAAAKELEALRRMQMPSKDGAFLESKGFACGGIVIHDEVMLSNYDKDLVEQVKHAMLPKTKDCWVGANPPEICTREIDPKWWYTLNINPYAVAPTMKCVRETNVVDQMMADGYGTLRAAPAVRGLLAVAPMPNAWGR